ncbi:Ig-like domain-containing protein, partial [Vogesella indigofera]|uniref:Ig-like domain-containing protein n=1 Tax=Vogesella indigofera TaxID=45465 RepID=UPI003F420B07
SDASNTLSVDLTGVSDAAGNAGSGSSDSGNIAIDTARPTLSVGLSSGTLLPNQTAVVTFTFSEPPLGFGLEDVQAGGGTLSDLRQGDSPNVWLATFTPIPGIFANGNAITVLGGWTDLAGNTQLATVQSDSYVVNTFVENSKPVATTVETPAAPSTVDVTPPAAVDGDGAAFVQNEAVVQITNALSPTIAQLAQLVVPAPQETAVTQQTVTPPELSLTQSRAGAFQVLVLPQNSGDDTLSVYNPLRDQQVQQGSGEKQISLPADLFAHTNPNETVVLLATQVDGQPLPAWVQFDPLTGKLVVDADKAPPGEMVVKVVARDTQNREAITTFKLVVGDKRAQLERKTVEGKVNLSAQLQQASRAQQQTIVEKIASGLSRLVKLG